MELIFREEERKKSTKKKGRNIFSLILHLQCPYFFLSFFSLSFPKKKNKHNLKKFVFRIMDSAIFFNVLLFFFLSF